MSAKPKDHTIQSAMWRIRRSFVPVVLISMVINLLMLTGPLYMLQIYDRVLSSRSIQTLVALTVLVIGLYALMMLLDGIRTSMMARIAAVFEARVAPAVFRANAFLAVKTHETKGNIDPVRDLDQCRTFLSGSGPLAMFDLPWMPLYLVVVFLIHPYLGFLALAGALVLIVVMWVNNSLSEKPAARAAVEVGARSSVAAAARSNPGATLGMGMLPNIARVWDKHTSALLVAQTSGSDRAGSFTALSKGTRMMLQSGILGMGAYLAILDQISAGMMIAASIITARALAPLEQTIASWRGLVAARQAKARLEATLNLSVQKKVKSLLPAPRDSLVVENLFSGPETGEIVLRGVSFKLKAGDGMGIVGPSGSGKTTLSRAILGIWPTLNGSIRLDGSTLDQWEPEAIGRSIGFLPQDVGLFDGTIGQNIARFDPDASSEAILNAARLAGVHDLIVQLPDGYDTLLGEGAHDLSAGQRQRVGLARALYGDPFLVVLDEPNANLDADGDALLSKAIASVRARGGIVLVIAHRPSALAAVDHLLMIKNGRQQAFGEKENVLGAIARNAEKLKSTIGLKVVEHGKA